MDAPTTRAARHRTPRQPARAAALAFLAVACGEHGTRVDGGGAPDAAVDQTAPTIGTAITLDDVTVTGLTVSWGAAVDDVTAAAALEYKVVRAATAAAIDSLAEVAAITSGPGLVQAFAAGATSLDVAGLSAATDHAFAVAVRDAAGNQALYAPAVGTTLAAQGIELVGGGSHACARLSDGSVKCWGNNAFGELGLGDTQNRGDDPGEMGANLPAVDLGTGAVAVALTAGESFTCALLEGGTVKCWGAGFFGALGLGDTLHRGDGPGEMGDALPAVNLGTGRTAVAFDAGRYHVCARLDDASLKCWGGNTDGALGLGDALHRGDEPGEMGDALPTVNLGAGRTAVEVAAGLHTCARLDDASLKCWGYNEFGQLGAGDAAKRGDGPGEMGEALPAVDLGTGRTAVALALGPFHSCAVLDDASVKCWGFGGYGLLGLGDSAYRGDGAGEMGDALPAVSLGTGRTAVAITAGFYFTCARLDDASLKCWGANGGQLGIGDAPNRGDDPDEMGDALPAVSLGTDRDAVASASGYYHTCARLDDASLKCWGSNGSGQLGLGDTSARGDAAGELGDDLPALDL